MRQKNYCSPWTNNFTAGFPQHLDFRQLAVSQAGELRLLVLPSGIARCATQTEPDDPGQEALGTCLVAELVVLSKLFYIWREDQEKQAAGIKL